MNIKLKYRLSLSTASEGSSPYLLIYRIRRQQSEGVLFTFVRQSKTGGLCDTVLNFCLHPYLFI